MTSKTQNGISQAFVKDSDEYGYAESYLSELRQNWRDSEKLITRASGLIVGIAAAFEIVIANKATGASLLGIKLSSTDVLQLALPALVAYLYYSATFTFIETAIYSRTHDEIIARLYPKISKANGEFLLHPSNTLSGSVDTVSYSVGDETVPGILSLISGAIRPSTIVIAPPIFIAVAYFQLFHKYSLNDALLWVSLAVSAILICASLINISITLSLDTRPRSDEAGGGGSPTGQPKAPDESGQPAPPP